MLQNVNDWLALHWMWLYAAAILWLIYLAFRNWRDRKRWRASRQYAHCRCGERLSEWFVRGGCMWHPEFVRGCGWISPWSTHEEYLSERRSGDGQ